MCVARPGVYGAQCKYAYICVQKAQSSNLNEIPLEISFTFNEFLNKLELRMPQSTATFSKFIFKILKSYLRSSLCDLK